MERESYYAGPPQSDVAANDYSRYGLVLYGVKAKDIKSMDKLFAEGVRACLQAELVEPALIGEYMAACGDAISYSKTASHAVVARLNKLCMRAEYFTEYMRDNTLPQRHILPAPNNDFITHEKAKKGLNFAIPYELLADRLAEYFGRNPVRCQAAELEVELKLETPCTRRIVVPLDYTFRQLHLALQSSFCWKGYHLHEFRLGQPSDGLPEEVLTRQEPEEEYNGESVHMDTDVVLRDVFPQQNEIVYNYDFGDDWTHTIRLVRIIEDYDKNYPVCLSGKGDAPPEDAGGSDGFAEMLRILADPQDPEYEDRKAWNDEMF